MGSTVHRIAWVVILLLLNAIPALAADDNAAKIKIKKRVMTQLAEENNGNMVFVTAAEMRQDYESNEVAADAKYKGKWIQLKGRLLSVGKSPLGYIYLELQGDQYGFARIHARLFSVQITKVYKKTKEFDVTDVKNTVMGLGKGQQITIEGKGIGSRMGMPRLTDCLLPELVTAVE